MKNLQTFFASLTAPIKHGLMRRYVRPLAVNFERRQKRWSSLRKDLYIVLLMFVISIPLIIVHQVLAAQVKIDDSPSGSATSHNGSSPTVVFTSDQTGYAFYRDSDGTCVYSKTTNGGTSWGSAISVDAQNDCIKIAVWYDRWTPGDDTNTNIHIVTADEGSDDLYYRRLNTATDTFTPVGGPVNTTDASSTNQGGTFTTTSSVISITKGTDGDLYMGILDDADNFVIKCTGTCENAANWTEAGTIASGAVDDDWLILMPLSLGNIMAIRYDVSVGDVEYKIYTDSTNTWGLAWVDIDANANVNTTYDAPFGATVNKANNTIYLAYAADTSTLGTDDDIRTASYNGTTWTARSNVLTDDARGVTGVKIATKENTETIFVVYTVQTTAGVDNSANVYYKRSTDGMITFDAEQGPLNTIATAEIYGARVNIDSNERIYATWYAADTNDLFGNTVADLAATAVEMADFTAKSDGKGVLLEWRTGYEVDNLGFNLYREKKGKRTRVNSSTIAGSAFVAGPGTKMTAGDAYAWYDPQGSSDSVYYLEEVDLNGTRTLHNPVLPTTGTLSANDKARYRQAMLLSELNTQDASASGVSKWQKGWPEYTGTGRELLYNIKPGADLRSLIAAHGAVKLSVNKEGWYRVTQSDLAAAGFNESVDSRMLQLYAGGVQVPILMNAAKEKFSPGDSFEFYGTGLDTPTTETSTYWLVVGNGKGLRINPASRTSAKPGSSVNVSSATSQTQNVTGQGQTNLPQVNPQRLFIFLPMIAPSLLKESVVKPKSDDDNAKEKAEAAPTVISGSDSENARKPTKKARKTKARNKKARLKASSHNHAMLRPAAVDSYPYTVELKERLIYVSGLRNGEKENFFGNGTGGSTLDQQLFVENLNAGATGSAQLEVVLQGYTLLDHKVKVKLNGQDVGTMSFSGQENSAMKFSVPHSLLREGGNTVTLERLNGQTDISFVDYIRLTYEHSYRASNNVVKFSAEGSTRLDGFTNGQIRVVDISDPLRIRDLNCAVESTSQGFAVSLHAPGEGVYLAFTDEQALRPASIELDKPSDLKSDDNGADLVIISYGEFVSSVQPLAAQRRSEGLAVSVVDVQDVYDEFSGGAHSPYAIRDFLSWAKKHWQKSPQFVLLVGDAGIDPRDYQGNGLTDFVPTKLIDVSTMETASDDWLADFNQDGVAEMAVGRLPVRTKAEADQVVSKIIGYTPGNALQQVLMVVDKNNATDGFSFAQTGADLGALLPSSVSMNTINRANSSDDAALHSQIVGAINQGPLMVNYIGHGSVEVWTGASLLSTSDTATLSNSNRLPVFVMMTCLNGYFPNPARDSLAEALLRNNSSGAVAVWASSGMTEPNAQSEMNKELYKHVFSQNGERLGTAVLKAKESTNDMEVRLTWNLFGDPTMKLR